MSVLTDSQIAQWAQSGGVVPYNPLRVNKASMDLCWSGRVRLARPKMSNTMLSTKALRTPGASEAVLERLFYPEEERNSYLFHPGCFYLIDTAETLKVPDNLLGLLERKPTLGRMGLEYQHAGVFEPGFCGTVHLEVQVRAPWDIELHKGEPIVQMLLIRLSAAPLRPYLFSNKNGG